MDSIYGYKIRKKLYPKEDEFFKEKTHVAGMASEDGRIILNPYSKLSEEKLSAVAANEAARLYLREKKLNPDFEITPEQHKQFIGTEYEGDEDSIRHTLIGRGVSGDSSAGELTEEQMGWVNYVLKELKKRQR